MLLPDDDLPELELQPRHRREVSTLANLMHVGLLLVCASAIYTLQPPTIGMERWLGLGLLAIILLVWAAATRGRCAFTDGGKLLTALAAGIVLNLAYEPQLANLGNFGENMPSWAMGLAPGLAMAGVILAASFGLWYLRTLNNYLRHGHTAPFRWGLHAAFLLVIALGLITFLALDRLYQMEPMDLSALLGNALQYYLLLLIVINVSGRTGVGAVMQVYFAATLLLALARNVIGGGGA